MSVRSIRGAITVNNDTEFEILDKTKKLFLKIVEMNSLLKDDIIDIIFSVTDDLRKVYPARAIRELGILDIPMMCLSEANIDGSLRKCIRILVRINTDKTNKEMNHVYLGGAMALRKDLAKIINIAIDGPAGAGKSTIADLVSKRLSIIHIDTGAMYRAVAYCALQRGYDIASEEQMKEIVDNIDLDQKYIDGVQKIYLNGEDITDKIRTPEISRGASDVAKLACVRERLTYIQREMAKKESVVMDGRDIGSFVLKNADLKIFLTASVEERTRRRYKDLKGVKDVDIEEVRKDIISRDENDTNRKISPLKMANDAVLLDSTGMSIEEVVNKIIDLVSDI